ncbi:GABA transporter 1-like protein [Drosera capensis]
MERAPQRSRLQKMGTVWEQGDDEKHLAAPSPAPAPPPQDLDAGALFVLQSKGSWMHCGYHLTTSIVGPPLLSLPYAFAFLGWTGGVICLVIGALVTFYSYNLISLVLEHHAQLGHRHLRFRDMAYDILGPWWGKYYVGPVQFAVCYAAVVGCSLLGGECMKRMLPVTYSSNMYFQAIYILSTPNGTMKLYEFVALFGVLLLILAQMPSFHSLRHINLISLVLCLAFSACATACSIYIGLSSKAPEKSYSIVGNGLDCTFDVFNAISIIATTYGNGIIPEIQATLAPPVKGKMFKGLSLCYAVVLATFFTVSISGYWAFGNQSQGQILSNFTNNGVPLVPRWVIYMTNAFVILQLAAICVVYLQPTNEVLENLLSDPKSDQFSTRNVIPRLISRSIAIIIGTLIGAMLPFFADFLAVLGAFGFLPLDFVLPAVFFNITFKPSKRSFVFWLNITIAVVFSIVCVIGSVATVRQVILDAKTYRLFANI